MKLIVGLGNPGRKYQRTRHNVGFDVMQRLAQRFADGSVKSRFQGEVVEANLSGIRSLLLCPHTYMNRSGQSVLAARDYYRLENESLLIVCDDLVNGEKNGVTKISFVVWQPTKLLDCGLAWGRCRNSGTPPTLSCHASRRTSTLRPMRFSRVQRRAWSVGPMTASMLV